MEQPKQQLCLPIQLPDSAGPAYALLQLLGFTRSLQTSIEAANSSSTESGTIRKKSEAKRSRAVFQKTLEAAAAAELNSKKQKKHEARLGNRQEGTQFVQVDSSCFRELVQKLTGAGSDCKDKMPVTHFKCSSRRRMRKNLAKLDGFKREKKAAAAAAAVVPSPKSPLANDPFGCSPSSSEIDCCGAEEVESAASDLRGVDQAQEEEEENTRCLLHSRAAPRLLALFPLSSSPSL